MSNKSFAYWEGYYAYFSDDLTSNDNPYDSTESENYWLDWNRGYANARKDD